MQSLNNLYQKTLLKILNISPKYQPGQACPADFLFAFPTSALPYYTYMTTAVYKPRKEMVP